MRRGRNKPKRSLVVDDVRRSVQPMVVVCHSGGGGDNHEWIESTEPLCSKKNAWRVWVYNPDINQWWDHISKKNTRASHEPAEGTLCHLVLLYSTHSNRQPEQDRVVHEAALRLGERVEVATVAILQGEAPPEALHSYETAIQTETAVWKANTSDVSMIHASDSQGIKHLWSLQEAFDRPKAPLQWDQVEDICLWPPIVCRWNGRRLRNLYQRLRQGNHPARATKHQDEYVPHTDDAEEIRDAIVDWDSIDHVHSLRRRLEEKMVTLLEDPTCKRIADQVLTARSEDNFAFGRTLAVSASCARPNCDYLVAEQGKGAAAAAAAATLNPLAYATGTQCSCALDKLQILSPLEAAKKKELVIPMGNPMIAMALLPALFLTGAEDDGIQLDPVLGSRRIWEEHLALKASILYVFEGQSKRLWDMAMSVVKTALPKTWDSLFLEPPDEQFLRALMHPDVVDGGRLRRDHGKGRQLLPARFETMARIYSIARFFRSLPMEIFQTTQKDHVCASLSSTMKLSPEQVHAIADVCMCGPFGSEDSMKALRIQDFPPKYTTHGENDTNQQADTEIMGMLALFLQRDRQSYRDSSTGKVCDLSPIASCTSHILADCAMYCGAIRWLSDNEQELEGLWTCLSCLHRWQRRQKYEAFQARKCMHPLTLIPFSREEYYDPIEWDNITEATGGNFNKLGTEYYYGECSSEGCRRIAPAVARAGACAETDGIPLDDFPETVTLTDESVLGLKATLKSLGPLGANNIVTSSSLEQFFDSEEKLAMLPDPIRRRVRNCIDKSRYILPRGMPVCDTCSFSSDLIDEYCPYCATGFDPIFACVHYHCPRCHKHFCKACLGIEGIHFHGVYSKKDHICWAILGNRYAYKNKGLCAKCGKERPWPSNYALKSAGPEIHQKVMGMGGKEISLEESVNLQKDNLATFTSRYKEAVEVFKSCSHTVELGETYCHCGSGVDADQYDGGDY